MLLRLLLLNFFILNSTAAFTCDHIPRPDDDKDCFEPLQRLHTPILLPMYYYENGIFLDQTDHSISVEYGVSRIYAPNLPFKTGGLFQVIGRENTQKTAGFRLKRRHFPFIITTYYNEIDHQKDRIIMQELAQLIFELKDVIDPVTNAHRIESVIFIHTYENGKHSGRFIIMPPQPPILFQEK